MGRIHSFKPFLCLFGMPISEQGRRPDRSATQPCSGRTMQQFDGIQNLGVISFLKSCPVDADRYVGYHTSALEVRPVQEFKALLRAPKARAVLQVVGVDSFLYCPP